MNWHSTSTPGRRRSNRPTSRSRKNTTSVSRHADTRQDSAGVTRLDAALLQSWPLPVDDGSDKYSRGTVLVVGGSTMTPGAVLLAGRAALRMGAGRVQVATAPEVAIPVGVAFP